MGPDFLQDKLHLSLDRKFLSKKARLIRRCLRYTIPLYSTKTKITQRVGGFSNVDNLWFPFIQPEFFSGKGAVLSQKLKRC